MEKHYGGQSMVAPLLRVLVSPPLSAGWDVAAQTGRWQELGFHHRPDFGKAQLQHAELRRALEACGAQVLSLPSAEGLSLDAVYAHDASLITDSGALCLRMGKPARDAEPQAHRAFYESAGIPVLGILEAPGTAEAGDIVWLDDRTLLVGRGYRTNLSGIDGLRTALGPCGIQVLPAPLPHGSGPGACLHLMSLLSLLDEQTALVDLPMLSVETVELLRDSAFRLVEIDPSERASLACNVLSLGGGKLIALAENPRTNDRLDRLGYELHTFDGGEIAINGGGGPTCLTRPVLRRLVES